MFRVNDLCARPQPTMSFAHDLERYGPESPDCASLEAAQGYCARLARTHYENFSVVSLLTPKRLRPAFEAVYAFCRWADDLGDEVGDRDRATELLDWWRRGLVDVYSGRASHPVYVALRPVIDRHNIPIAPFEALISAFEQDQIVTEYETYDQLLDYCTRSANPVGRIVLYLCGCFTDENARLSDQTCTALQLANFWQDVSRDLAIGRIYLPHEDRLHFQVADQDLRQAPAKPSFRRLLKYEVERTRRLFDLGAPLAGRLPRDIAPSIALFSRGGMAILDSIAACDYDVLSARPALTRSAKLRLVARALGGRMFGLRKADQRARTLA